MVAKFYRTETRDTIECLILVLKRFCVRRFRGNPRMNVDESMSTLLFAENMGCEEFWGVGNEDKFHQFIELNLT